MDEKTIDRFIYQSIENPHKRDSIIITTEVLDQSKFKRIGKYTKISKERLNKQNTVWQDTMTRGGWGLEASEEVQYIPTTNTIQPDEVNPTVIEYILELKNDIKNTIDFFKRRRKSRNIDEWINDIIETEKSNYLK